MDELADTSAWTTRHRSVEVAAGFDEVVAAGRVATCPIVTLEVLRTARNGPDYTLMRQAFAALPQVEITTDVWERAADVLEMLAGQAPPRHRQIPFQDAVVAAAAELAGMPVVHYDRHFELIAEVTGQPVRAIAPLGSL